MLSWATLILWLRSLFCTHNYCIAYNRNELLLCKQWSLCHTTHISFWLVFYFSFYSVFWIYQFFCHFAYGVSRRFRELQRVTFLHHLAHDQSHTFPLRYESGTKIDAKTVTIDFYREWLQTRKALGVSALTIESEICWVFVIGNHLPMQYLKYWYLYTDNQSYTFVYY